MDTEAFVNPGKRVFEARLGEAKAQQEVQAVAGQEQQVTLRFEELTASAGPATMASTSTIEAGLPEAPKPTAPKPAPKRCMVPVYVGAGVAVVGLGVGIGFALAAGSDRDDIDALKQKNGPSGCSDGTAPAADCGAQRDAAQARDRHRTYEAIGFSVAGAALIGTATYFFWPESSPTTALAPRAFKLAGSASPDSARIWLLGNF
jgi:hypothetical protein